MKFIYLIRHCKAEGQEPSAKLTDEGMRQAEQLAKCLEDVSIQYIVSSPYDRAIHTIQPLAKKLHLSIHVDDRLKERILSTIDIPDWMGKLRDAFVNMDLKFYGGESSREAMNRGVSVIKEAIERPEKSIAIVTHGNLMALILKHFDDRFGFEEWKGLTNPDVYELNFTENRIKGMKRFWN